MKKKEWLLLAGVLIIDMLSKFYIQSTMAVGQSIPVIKNFFYITYTQNTGAAWSILEGKMIFFYIVTAGAIVFLIQWLKKTKGPWGRTALVLMIAGAGGNLIDRGLFQYVRDFLDFYIFGYDFPIFNVADMSLCIGVLIMAITLFLTKEEA